MESPTRISQAQPQQLSFSPSLRRLSTDSTSPDFEFVCPPDPSSPLSADQLFSGGVLLPLSLLSLQPPDPQPEPPPAALEEAKPSSSSVADPPSASKRWRDIFKKAEKKPDKGGSKDGSEKKKKNKKKGQAGGSGSPELNINIWPFSRSRSAGNGGSRPRTAAASVARKVSSAPCSRSNSAGENKTRKWPNSPGRAGVHLARNSPVWQMKRTGSTGLKGCDPIANKQVCHKESGGDAPRRNQPAARARGSRWGGRASGAGGGKASVLNLNVPMCIGYRQHLSCRGGDSSAIAIGAGTPANCGPAGDGVGSSRDGVSNGSNSSSNLFNLRNLFSKKVY